MSSCGGVLFASTMTTHSISTGHVPVLPRSLVSDVSVHDACSRFSQFLFWSQFVKSFVSDLPDRVPGVLQFFTSFEVFPSLV